MLLILPTRLQLGEYLAGVMSLLGRWRQNDAHPLVVGLMQVKVSGAAFPVLVHLPCFSSVSSRYLQSTPSRRDMRFMSIEYTFLPWRA